MQAVRVSLAALFLMLAGGCGSSSETPNGSSKTKSAAIEAWYLLEVGGQPETGRSHYYSVKLPEGCSADSIYLNEEAYPFRPTNDKEVWQAYRHFDIDDKVPGGLISGTLNYRCNGKRMVATLDSIYLNESIILP